MIAANLTRQQYTTWFAPIQFVSFDEATRELTLSVPSPFFHEYLEEHYVNLIRSALYRYYGTGVRLSYFVTTDAEHGMGMKEQATELKQTAPMKTEQVNQSPQMLQHVDSNLRPTTCSAISLKGWPTS